MDAKAELGAIRERTRALVKAVNAPMRAFGQLGAAVKEPGALSVKEKEYVALGIAVAQGCDDCVTFHLDVLRGLGARRDEIAEVLGMCLQMGGGPVVMNAGRALQVWDELSA